MSGEAGPGRAPTPFERARDIDAWCDRFESGWRAGRRPRVEDYLADAPGPIRADLRPELVALEAALRRECERTTPDEPQSPPPDTALDLDPVADGPARGGATSRPDRPATGVGVDAAGPATRLDPLAPPPGAIGKDEEPASPAAPECATLDGRRVSPDRACAGDPGLSERVDRLLAAHEATLRDLDPPAGSLAPQGADLLGDSATGERAGAVIAGRYRLIEEVGEGGMGSVWLAEQSQPVRRQVALKLVKPGMDSRSVLARFEAERQALAMMDHPNIAKVLDGGTTERGRPFFVMEYVKGAPITKFCDDAGLDLSGRLELFATVCRAVQHAHTKGVIHRDLKPSNILVALCDGRPEPKVIDFGLAKALREPLTDRTLLTAHGAMIGTPLYMSPEQAEFHNLDVDTRTDVYALGAILYELLTGTPPLEKDRLQQAAWDELLRLIREEEPPRPSDRLSGGGSPPDAAARHQREPWQLARLVRGELDWIVMKCLEKDRTRRYETADALARDIERYLADESVEACPPSTGYRLRKFVRRHRHALTAALAFLLLLISSVVALTIALVAADRERQQKEIALNDEGRRRKQARAALDAMSSQIIEDWLAKQAALLPEHRQFLEQSLRDYEEFAADTGQEEESRAGAANAYRRVGFIRNRLGQRKDAEAAWEIGRERYARLVADFPSKPGYQSNLGLIHRDLARLFEETGRLSEAETAYAESLAMYKRLADAFPGRPEPRLDLAKVLQDLASLLSGTGRPSEAEDLHRQSIATCRQLVADFPDSPDYRVALARGLFSRGISLKNAGRPKEAEGSYRESVALYNRLVADFPASPDYRFLLAQTLMSLGLLLDTLDRPEESEDAYGRSVGISRQLAADFPTVPDYRESLARGLSNIGDVFRNLKRHAAAEEAFLQSLTIRKQLAADFPAVTDYRQGQAMALNNLGILLKDTGRAQKAEGLYGEALAIHKKLAADFPTVPDHQNDVAGAMTNLARLLLIRDEPLAARRLLEDALPHHQAALEANPNHPGYRKCYRLNRWRTAEALLALEDHAAAARAVREFLQYATEPPRDAYTAATLLAGCVRLAAQDEHLGELERQELTAAYGDSALAALREAITKGAKEVAQMATDPSLDPLRPRPDFRELVDELEATRKP